MARGPAARDRLAARPQPRARRRARRAVAGDRRAGADADRARSEPAAILAALRAEPALSHVSLVPAQLARLLDAAGDAAPPPSLRAVLLGGGTIPPALVTRALDAGWPVVPTYGLSEAGSGVTALATAEAREAPSSAGRPLPGVTVEIEEPDADGIGEIVVTTPARFAGYSGEPAGRRPDPHRRPRAARRRRPAVRRRPPDRPDRARRREHLAGRGRGRPRRAAGDRRRGRGRAARRRSWARSRSPRSSSARAPPTRATTRSCAPAARRSPGSRSRPRSSASTRCPGRAGGKLRRDAVRALVDGAAAGILARPDGDEIGWRVTGAGATAARPASRHAVERRPARPPRERARAGPAT